MTQRMFIVHGMGPDAVGLVGRITESIAQAQGNIIDLRQDVLHGLFTIYLVVDFGDKPVQEDALQALLTNIGAETGLKLTAGPYQPVPRRPDLKNLLIILLGRDRPGIVATSSKLLGKYQANIELAQAVGRENVFLMELLTDVSRVTIPLDNLKRSFQKNMETLNIKAVFQDEHVFNKRKRVILFHIPSSFMNPQTRGQIMEQAGLEPEQLAAVATPGALVPSCRRALALLEGVPLEVIDTVLKGVSPTAGTRELIQTLKTMGYKIVLVSGALSFFTSFLKERLDLDYAYGVPHVVDDDARTLTDELALAEPGIHDMDAVLSQVMALEKVEQDDITILTDEGCAETPGLRLDFHLDVLLDCYNGRALSQQNLLGLLAGLGMPQE